MVFSSLISLFNDINNVVLILEYMLYQIIYSHKKDNVTYLATLSLTSYAFIAFIQ